MTGGVVTAGSGVHGVVRRAASVLRTLAECDSRGLSAAETARRTGIPLQTAHRILGELAGEGLSLQNPASKTWTLGPELLALGSAAGRQVNWVNRTRDVLRAISAETRETTVLTARTGTCGTIVDLVESPQPLRMAEHVGLRMPLNVGASRLVILAALGAVERAAVLDELAGQGVPIHVAAVESQCAAIAAAGYAVGSGEVTPYTVGVAVPVVVGGTCVGSMMVGGPVHRMGTGDVSRLSELLTRRVREVSQFWAAQPPFIEPSR